MPDECSNTCQARKAITMSSLTTDVVQDDIALRNDCIMTAMKRAEAMLRSYAQTHDLDFEDLYQDIAELMLHVWERMPVDVESPVPYLYGAARLQMRLIVRRISEHAIPTTSIDAPVFEDSELTLEDMIQAADMVLRTKAEQEQEELRADRIEETVHDVLHTCCYLEEQEYAKRTWAMGSFEPMQQNDLKRAKSTRYLGSTGRSAGNLRESVRKVFRKNPHVQALVQRETCVM